MHGLHIFNSPLINRINPDGISHAKLESIAKGYEFRGVVSGEEEDCLIGKGIAIKPCKPIVVISKMLKKKCLTPPRTGEKNA